MRRVMVKLGWLGVVLGGCSGLVDGYAPPPVLPWVGDQYAHVDEGAAHEVARAPRSTFSIDVDTASYANVRRMLREGGAPPADAVRVEELINAFDYDGPQPDGELPLAVHADVTDAPWAEGHRLVRIGVQARRLEVGVTPPRNLVFLVDVSGSMDGPDRLDLVKQGLYGLAAQLGATDHVAIVTYAGSSAVALAPTRGDDHATIDAAIDALSAGGSTAGADGITTAYALAREHFQDGAVNRVLLATDGDFNVGVESPDALEALVAQERGSGVYLSVLGFGRGNLGDARMERLADKGNGNYAYIDSAAELRRVLGTQLAATLVPVADDVKVQVEFNPLEVRAWRLIGYENRVLADEAYRDVSTDAGELGAGQHVTALYDIVPADGASLPADPLRYQGARAPTEAAASGELLTVRVAYRLPASSEPREVITLLRDDGTPFHDAPLDTRFAAAVAGFGMLLRDSPHRGALDWAWVRDTARGALGPDTHGQRAELLELVDRATRLAEG